MGRILAWSGIGVAAAFACLVIARRRRHPSRPTGSEHPGTEIAPGVFALGPWGRTQTNVYLVRDGAAWFLVDAGWSGDRARIEAAVRSVAGPEPTPSAILLTHAHPDHSGSARALAEAWGCPVYAHPAELPIATGDFAAMVAHAGPLDRWLVLPMLRALGRRRRNAALAASSPAGVVRPLGAGGTIPGVGDWRWVHAPGHTPGHVAFVRAGDRVVITGDALVTLAVNSPAGLFCGKQGLSGPPWYTTWDAAAAAASIRVIAGLEPAVVGSGHGLPLAGPGVAASVCTLADRTARGSG